MGSVTIRAAVTNWRVFKQKRSALFRVALIAGLIYRVSLQQRVGRAPMGVVAVEAGDLAFRQGHVRTAHELGTLLLVASETDFVDTDLLEQAALRELCHRIVAVAAGQILAVMGRSRPMQAFPATMTGYADVVLLRDRRCTVVGKANNSSGIDRVEPVS